MIKDKNLFLHVKSNIVNSGEYSSLSILRDRDIDITSTTSIIEKKLFTNKINKRKKQKK